MMAGTGMVALAAAAFVGSHFLLSHPLRAPFVARLGERGFLGVYSLVTFATLGWLAEAYRHSPPETPLWPTGDALWVLASVIMLLAGILFLGSLIRNPALPGMPATAPEPRGVFTWTRHPMLWSFALWALAHALVWPILANFVLVTAIAILALVGAALQDAKKATLQPATWPVWERRTSYWPFAAIAAGRTPFRLPGVPPLLLAVVLWLAITWAHLPLAGVPAGVWRWIG